MRPPCQATVTRADRSAWGPRRRLRNRRRDLRITASLGGVKAGYRTGQPQTISALGANPASVRPVASRHEPPPRLCLAQGDFSRRVWPAVASCHGFGAGPSPDRLGPRDPRARDAGADLSVFGAPQRRALRAAIGATVAFYLGWIVIDDAVLAVFRNAERDRTPGTGRLRRRPRAAGTRLRACDGGRRCAGRARDRRVRAHLRGRRAAVRGRAVRVAVHGGGAQRGHGANGVLLFFLVACAVPAPLDALDSRVEGVLLGGGISLLAAPTIWRVPVARKARLALSRG